jgi:hypothetical protein
MSSPHIGERAQRHDLRIVSGPGQGPRPIGALCHQSSRLAEFFGRGMPFKICRGALGSLAKFTASRNATSRVSSFALDRRPASSSQWK